MKPSRGVFPGIIIHHSATRDSETKSWEAIRRFHVGNNGFDAIGYHFGMEDINRQLVILSGRGLEWQGAHCAGSNDYLGICVVGDFDKEAPSNGKLTDLLNLVIGLMIIYGIESEDVHPHSDFSNKTCPGTLFPWSDFHSVLAYQYKQLSSVDRRP